MRVSIAGVFATAVLGASAASASASEVWMWACHGPNGQALTDANVASGSAKGGTVTNRTGGGCTAAGDDAGKTLTAAGEDSSAELVVATPRGLNVKKVRILRRANGLGVAGSATYSATYGAYNDPTAGGTTTTPNGPQTALPDTDFSVAAPEFAVAGEGALTLKLSCTAACTGSLDVAGVAFLVEDKTAPYGASGNGSNPVVTSRPSEDEKTDKYTPVWEYEVPLTASGRDSGVGLDRAVVTVSGPGLAAREFPISFGCTDLSPGDAVNDRPLDRSKCKTEGSLTTADAFKWHTLIPGDGIYSRSVTIYDAAGNKTEGLINEQFDVVFVAKPIATRTLSIGTDPLTLNENPNGPNTNPNNGGVLAQTAANCRTPRLSVVLKTKPVRVAKGVPVVQYKKKYTFTGRLTCVINGKRQSAPKRTKIFVFNKVGKKTIRKPNTSIRAKGAVDVKLAFVSSRTVTFRYTNPGGQKSEVKIKVRVTKQKK